jgi:hypothetical protein
LAWPDHGKLTGEAEGVIFLWWGGAKLRTKPY